MEGDLGSAFQKGKTLLTKSPVVSVQDEFGRQWIDQFI